jgi:hypothetical protein
MSKYQAGDDVLVRGRLEEFGDYECRIDTGRKFIQVAPETILPGNLMGIVKEIDDLREDRDTLAGQLADLRADAKRFCEERDAARAEAATLRALLPEVRRFVNRIATNYNAERLQYFQLAKDACDLLAKLPPEQAPEQPATAEPKRCEKCGGKGTYIASGESGGKEEYLCVCGGYRRETTPQPQPATGNVPLQLVGPASLAGKTLLLMTDNLLSVAVEVRA